MLNKYSQLKRVNGIDRNLYLRRSLETRVCFGSDLPFPFERDCKDWADFFPGKKNEFERRKELGEGARILSCPDTKWPLKRDFALADMDRAFPGGRRDRCSAPGRNGELPEDGVGVAMATTIPQ